MLKPVIAATAALAIAGSTLVYAQQRFDGHGGFGNGGPRAEHQHRHLSPDDVAALGDARIAAMKAGLELTPDQAKNWPAFEQAVRNMVQLRVQRIQARQAAAQGSQQQGSQNAAPVTPFDRMSHRADSMTKRGAALKQIADAGAPLYASLNDAQKSRFTLLARMLRPHEHQHAMNGGGQRFGQGDGRGGQEGSGHRHVGQGGPGGSGGPDGQGWGNRRFGQEGQDGQGGPDGQGWWGHHRFGQNGGMHNMSNSDNNSDDGSQL
jgi:zinc resistance-associated protein